MVKLNTLSSKGTTQNRKRVGRGIGSGQGKTAGRGHKGQNQDLVVRLLVALKVVKCHYNKEYLSLVSLHG